MKLLNWTTLLVAFVCTSSGLQADNAGLNPQVLSGKTSLPAVFIENPGSSQKFTLRNGAVAAVLQLDGIRFVSRDKSQSWSMRYVNPSADTSISGSQQVETVIHRYSGADGNAQAQDIRAFRAVRVNDIWRGINAEFYLKDQALKYDFIVQPHADPSLVALEFSGAEDIWVDSNGRLQLRVQGRTVTEDRPCLYQPSEEGDIPVSGSFVVEGNTVRFDIGQYNPSLPLVIDPETDLVWSSLLGGNDGESLGGVAAGPDGSVYLAGQTVSLDFPTAGGGFDPTPNGFLDAYVARLSADGSQLLFAAFLGGLDDDWAEGIDVDPQGSAYVVGYTFSQNFPTTPGVLKPTPNRFVNGYATKLSPTGQLVYSTFIGGSRDDWAFGVAVDAQGFAYITGQASSTDFPTTTGAFDRTYGGLFDGYALKLNQNASALVYGTYLGGSSSDWGVDIAVDSQGWATVAGLTQSGDYPVTPGAFDTSYNGLVDTFVSRLNPGGTALEYSTYLGGSSNDAPNAVALAPDGGAVVVGITQFTDLPVTPGAFDTSPNGQSDGFVFRLSPSGTSAVFGTYLGTSGTDRAVGVDTDALGNIYVTGSTCSPNFPLTGFGYQNEYAGGPLDAWLAVFNPAGSELLYSTFFGGEITESGQSVVVLAPGNVLIAGETDSTEFPVTENAYDTTANGQTDIFAARFWFDVTPSTTPVVVDDGVSTGFGDELHAVWTSTDPESEVIEYRYTIATSPVDTGEYLVPWTSSGSANEETVSGLTLESGVVYYWYVQARNSYGIWSATGVSDGISYDPTIQYILYVRPDGSDTVSGLSWDRAKRTVQAAINRARVGDQVWVASGTYNENITMKAGVAVHGGFSGTETSLAQRPEKGAGSPSILDGGGKNSVVVVSNGGSAVCQLDRFTIRNGSGVTGGGIRVSGSTIVLSDLVIHNNSTPNQGGGVYLFLSNASLVNSVIHNNSAQQGGGVYLLFSQAVVAGNVVHSNSATTGGGLYLYNDTSYLTNNTIASNTATQAAGGLYLRSSSPHLSNSIIAFNSAGIIADALSTAVLHSNNLHGNVGGNYIGLQAGVGDITTDPQFVSLAQADFRLNQGSAAIDAGWSGAVGIPDVDITGAPRVSGASVDMGAYESNYLTYKEVTIPEAKLLGDGWAVIFDGVVVTALFDGIYYVSQPERSAGMRVEGSTVGLNIGSVISVRGTLVTSADQERFLQSVQHFVWGQSGIRALTFNTAALGGARFPDGSAESVGQTGISWVTAGLNNVGLLARVAGVVTSTIAETGEFTISDGARWPGVPVADWVGNPGVRVKASGLTLPQVGSKVIVEGAVSLAQREELIYPYLLVDLQQRIQEQNLPE